MQDNRIPPQTRPMTEAEILRRRKLRRAAIKKQKRRRTLFLYAFDKNQPFSAAKQTVRQNIPARTSSYQKLGVRRWYERYIGSVTDMVLCQDLAQNKMRSSAN